MPNNFRHKQVKEATLHRYSLFSISVFRYIDTTGCNDGSFDAMTLIGESRINSIPENGIPESSLRYNGVSKSNLVFCQSDHVSNRRHECI